MLEAKVHNLLKSLCQQRKFHCDWLHSFTMARMVARGLRLKDSTIIQTGVSHSHYCLSYLIPLLLSEDSEILVASTPLCQTLFHQQIPLLQQHLNSSKQISPHKPATPEKKTLYLLNYDSWLDYIFSFPSFQNDRQSTSFPTTILVEAERLPDILSSYFTRQISPSDWYFIIPQLPPSQQEYFRQNLVQLTKSILSHPLNRYNSYLLEEDEIYLLLRLGEILRDNNIFIPENVAQFFQTFHSREGEYVHYFSFSRQEGYFYLKATPINLKTIFGQVWPRGKFIIIGSHLDSEKTPRDYGRKIGLNPEDFTCLKFPPPRQSKPLKLYIPSHFPLPNTPIFATKTSQEITSLINTTRVNHCPIVVIIDDIPLQSQITASLAASFGSRVRLNETILAENSIIVCSTSYWLKHQEEFSNPQYNPRLIIMPTLPIPSVENPLVAAQVNLLKKQKKDWFRLYLLPTAIQSLQRITQPLRQYGGVLVLLDGRVNCRGYGNTILQALEPYIRIQDYTHQNLGKAMIDGI